MPIETPIQTPTQCGTHTHHQWPPQHKTSLFNHVVRMRETHKYICVCFTNWQIICTVACDEVQQEASTIGVSNVQYQNCFFNSCAPNTMNTILSSIPIDSAQNMFEMDFCRLTFSLIGLLCPNASIETWNDRFSFNFRWQMIFYCVLCNRLA